MTEEVFLSGFCKAQNQTRTVMCEYETDAQNRILSVESDCAFPDCPHSGSCVIFREMRKTGEKEQ